MKLELIQSVNPVTPTKGTNAGKPMFVINGKHWSKNEPAKEDTHVCLEDVAGEGEYAGKTFTNVIGYSKDSRMTFADKVGIITAHPEGYSQAIAMLLK
jgi:hypothetical protein